MTISSLFNRGSWFLLALALLPKLVRLDPWRSSFSSYLKSIFQVHVFQIGVSSAVGLRNIAIQLQKWRRCLRLPLKSGTTR